MNRWWLIIAVAVMLCTSAGCIREVDLTPYEIPDMVNSYIRKVECFEAHGTALVATDDGVMLLYGEDRVLLNAKNYTEINDIVWEDAAIMYAPSREVFWVIEGSTYLQIGRTEYTYHEDETEFYAPTKSYRDYALSPAGNLFLSTYYKEEWDGGFYTDYYIGVYEYLGNPNNTWRVYETDMFINTTEQADPAFTFREDGSLVFFTSPTYIVSSLASTNTVFDSVSKAGEGFKFKAGQAVTWSEEGMLMGLNIDPSASNPVTALYRSDAMANTVTRVEIEAVCSVPDATQGAVKLLDWDDEVARFYVQYYTNNLSQETEEIGYILEMRVDGAQCELIPLLSTDELKFSESITDLDRLGDEVFIGTRNGLLIYDLTTNRVEPYLDIVIESQEPQ